MPDEEKLRADIDRSRLVEALPTADSQWRGQLLILESDGSSTDDTPYVCIEQSDGTFAWKDVSSSGSGGAPTDATYLTKTSNATLSAEEVVGNTPGGELGGTWASPTVDATHSGSAHHPESHTIVSHSDTSATGPELDELTNGSTTSLHSHTGAGTHASTHVSLGSDEIDGDVLDIDHAPTNYTQDTSSPLVTTTSELTAHLKGIDNQLGKVGTEILGIVLNGDGSPPATGIQPGDIYVPWNCRIDTAIALADQTGSIVVDIWADANANYPPTDADTITGGAELTITSGVKTITSSLGSWTTTLTAGDTLRFNIDSVSTITYCTVMLLVTIL